MQLRSLLSLTIQAQALEAAPYVGNPACSFVQCNGGRERHRVCKAQVTRAEFQCCFGCHLLVGPPLVFLHLSASQAALQASTFCRIALN